MNCQRERIANYFDGLNLIAEVIILGYVSGCRKVPL
jgi:hypothetical protein